MQDVVGLPIATERCVFIDGHHVYSGPNCPHGRDRDEEGEVKPPGWTVQHG